MRLFEEAGPELLPYATLMTARSSEHAGLDVVEAVYEWQDAPLVFVIGRDRLEGVNPQNSKERLQRIRRLLAMRGDAPYLGVVAPGSLQVYRIALDRRSLRQAEVAQVSQEGEAGERSTLFPRLANERPNAGIVHSRWISNVVLRLLDGSMTSLIGAGVSDEDAISLVGRALFTRFLGDRDLLPANIAPSHTAAALFDDPDRAQQTSEWLDSKFNGDLLPLSEGIFGTLPAQSYAVLGDILRRAPDGQPFLGWEERWDNLDFAHIPVGVLSQAYELYLRKHQADRQRAEGGYFTPRPIADLMVRASFRALDRGDGVKKAKVLDPAVGGGIFLLTAFRELVAEHWRADGKRPDTAALRRILDQQLVGFDINESALRFAALGLYLLSIELDPNPRPVDKLGFSVLRGAVLHRVIGEREKQGKTLGSLGTQVGQEHQERYDLVIGNPPWASQTHLPEWCRVRAMVARIAASREIANGNPPLPNEVLDLPFVWRAMEWAKPNGQIAFALHARLLFQQGDGMPIARHALFEALDVTSVVNGVQLRQTKVWPNVSAPFCLLFATNRKPGPEAGFRLISPRIEDSLNNTGCMRIDALNAEVISSQQLFAAPELLKTLFRGSKLDFGILERIRAEGHPTLADFWRAKIGVARGKRLRGSGNGYQTLRKSSRTRKGGDGRRGVDASYLHGKPEITATSFSDVNIVVDTSPLDLFSHERIHDPRSADLFAGPQVIVHKSPPADVGRIRVAVTDEGVVFNETFYGYSPVGYAHPDLLVRYLALVLGSRLAVWLALVTSGEFGFERDVIEKTTLDRIPLPDLEELTSQQRGEIEPFIDGLQSGTVAWEEVDQWVMSLYGLGERDLEVIFDTLEFNLPFAKNKREAQAIPNDEDSEQFCEALRAELRPWCDRFGSSVVVDLLSSPVASPWRVVAVRTGYEELEEEVPTDHWAELLTLADASAASEVVLQKEPGELLIGRLAQRRYWSKTQARLLAQRIAWSHVELFKRQAME